jgi:hypothetical protein
MSQALSDDEKPLSPEAARAIARVRRLMLIASVTTFIAIGAVLVVIGYRVFHAGGSAPAAADVSASLPAGARIVTTSIGEGRLAVVIEINGKTELRLFDLATLKPAGMIKTGP